MVLILEGMTLRIPAGGLRITLDASEPPSVEIIELSFDTWQHWLRIALEHLDQSEQAHTHLLQANAIGDDQAKGSTLEREFKAAMLGICAAAFSLDAFYGSVKRLAPVNPDLEKAWRRKRTSRPARIVETLRRAFRLQNASVRQLQTGVGEVFRFRDWAVHPPAAFAQPVLHPDLGIGVDWRCVAFSYSNCRELSGFSLSAVAQIIHKPRPQLAELVEWCQFVEGVTKPLVEEWTQKYGPLF